MTVEADERIIRTQLDNAADRVLELGRQLAVSALPSRMNLLQGRIEFMTRKGPWRV